MQKTSEISFIKSGIRILGYGAFAIPFSLDIAVFCYIK
jgi:hypothetical protein